MELTQTVNTPDIHMSKDNAWHKARDAQHMGRQTILKRYAKSRADRLSVVTIDKELFMMHAKTVKM